MIQPMQINEIIKTTNPDLSQDNKNTSENSDAVESKSSSSSSGIELAAKLTAPMLEADIHKKDAVEAMSADNNLNSENDLSKQVEQLETMKQMAIKAGTSSDNPEEVEGESSSDFKLVSQNLAGGAGNKMTLNLGELKIDSPGNALDAVNKLDIEINKLRDFASSEKAQEKLAGMEVGIPEIKEIQRNPDTAKTEEKPNNRREEVQFEANFLKDKIEADAAGAMQAQGNITPQQTLALLK